VNYVINRYCRGIGLEMDRDGNLAAGGNVCDDLLNRLNALDYYARPYPKSLGREWVEKRVFPLLDGAALPLEDLLRTYYEHCAQQLEKVVSPGKSILATGGGAYNKFLIQRMKEKTGCEIIVPEPAIVEYKEALIFAFLGVLYMLDRPSCLSSVTGAARDNIGGMLFKV
jgi:anhydro-N-acetylmuramic acid kinase